MTFLGKTYSQHEQVIATLQRDGFDIHGAKWERGLDGRFSVERRSSHSEERRGEELLDHLQRRRASGPDPGLRDA